MLDYLKLLKKDIEVTICGDSMWPTLYAGENVKLKNLASYNNLKVGNIILFYSNKYKSYVLHRIIKKIYLIDGQVYYVTKGDNNLIEDEYLVRTEDIRGVL